MTTSSCWLCDTERHYCLGCGLTLEHGETKCYDCAHRSLEVADKRCYDCAHRSLEVADTPCDWTLRWEMTRNG